MTTVGTPLPKLNTPQIVKLGWTAESDHYRAYSVVLEAETYAVEHVYNFEKEAFPGTRKERDSARKVVEGKLVAVRVAGHLFLEFERLSGLFGIKPTNTLVGWFLSQPQSVHDNQRDVIIYNGELLRDTFIRAFRTSNHPYQVPSSHPSRASFDTLAEMIKSTMDATGRNYNASRKKMLARDGYRCVVTGFYDESSLDRCRELKGIASVMLASLQAAHIFNESTTQGIDHTITQDNQDSKTYNKTYHAATALAILKSFGFSEFPKVFEAANGVHAVWNLLSLHPGVHPFFDRLNMWFEHTHQLNRYQVCTRSSSHKITIDRYDGQGRQVDEPLFVEFNSEFEDAPPPHPLLLALHAACARVAHMSGAAEYFDQVERDLEDTRVLASDGSSRHLLNHVLSRFAAPISVA